MGPLPNQANYITLPDGFLSTTQDPNFQAVNYLTDRGAFTSSPSAYGAFDMAGSVWEWCDLEEELGYRYLRGGAWTSYAPYIQSSYRQGVTVNEAAVNGGFRLASQPGDIVFPNVGATPPPPPESVPPPSSGPPLPTLPDDGMVKMNMVSVGNADNAPEPSTKFGAVEYEFKLGEYLVTIEQYCTFLNAVAQTDTYMLYNERMASDPNIAGIARSGANGSFSYSVVDNDGYSGNRPISYVSFFDAARFANWMSNGQPIGPQDERSTEAGAYPLFGATDGVVPAKSAVNPNTGEPPSFYLPLEDEWYKAAFYDPSLNDGAGGYWTYATRNNTAPGNRVGPDVNAANYIANSLYSVTQSVEYKADENYLSEVGAFTNSPSSYGTFDQQGLLGEWNNVDGQASSSMGTRGSFWAAASAGLRGWAYTNAAQESNDLGFRVASPQGVGDATVGSPQPPSIAAPQVGLKFQAAFVTVLFIVTMF
jgi:sulfatase modifying factor 1